jgi:hypothetical protein
VVDSWRFQDGLLAEHGEVFQPIPATGEPLPPLTARFTSVSVREHNQWRIADLVAYTFLQPSGAT